MPRNIIEERVHTVRELWIYFVETAKLYNVAVSEGSSRASLVEGSSRAAAVICLEE